MCLLDEVTTWDAARISCRTGTHRDAHNPLRAHGRLGIACGVEYAAQAMAVHGALASGALDGARGAAGPPMAGFLASVRAVRFFVPRLDDVPGDLICDAVRVAGDAGTALYEFEVRSADTRLLCGRATVVLEVRDPLRP
jgi:predicted hotdog family 3-hydroxylacyl-ACP dehydratase